MHNIYICLCVCMCLCVCLTVKQRYPGCVCRVACVARAGGYCCLQCPCLRVEVFSWTCWGREGMKCDSACFYSCCLYPTHGTLLSCMYWPWWEQDYWSLRAKEERRKEREKHRNCLTFTFTDNECFYPFWERSICIGVNYMGCVMKKDWWYESMNEFPHYTSSLV